MSVDLAGVLARVRLASQDVPLPGKIRKMSRCFLSSGWSAAQIGSLAAPSRCVVLSGFLPGQKESASPVTQLTAAIAELADHSAMPVFLSFLICAASGGTCHVTVPLERSFAGISACQIEGMMITPQWQEQHPGWAVKRIRCSIGSRPQDEETA